MHKKIFTILVLSLFVSPLVLHAKEVLKRIEVPSVTGEPVIFTTTYLVDDKKASIRNVDLWTENKNQEPFLMRKLVSQEGLSLDISLWYEDAKLTKAKFDTDFVPPQESGEFKKTVIINGKDDGRVAVVFRWLDQKLEGVRVIPLP